MKIKLNELNEFLIKNVNKKFLITSTRDGHVFVWRFKETSDKGWCKNCDNKVKLAISYQNGKKMLTCPVCHKSTNLPKAKIL
jgi:Zn finger protein HypA/HybF involved in hydrogenase expression